MNNLLKVLNFTQSSGLTLIGHSTKSKFMKNGEWSNFTEIDLSHIDEGFIFVGDKDSWRMITIDGKMLDLDPFTTEEKDNLTQEQLTEIAGSNEYRKPNYSFGFEEIPGKSYKRLYIDDLETSDRKYGLEFANGGLVPCHFKDAVPFVDNDDDVIVVDVDGKWGVINSEYADTKKPLVQIKYASMKNALVAYEKLNKNKLSTQQSEEAIVNTQEVIAEHQEELEEQPEVITTDTAEVVEETVDSVQIAEAQVATYEIVSKEVKGETRYGVQVEGKLIIPSIYLEIKSHLDGLFLIKNANGKWGVKDMNGQTLVQCSCKTEEGAIKAYNRRLIPRSTKRVQAKKKTVIQEEQVKEAVVVEPTELVSPVVEAENTEEVVDVVEPEEVVEVVEAEVVDTQEETINGIAISIFEEGRDREYVSNKKAEAIARIKASTDKEEINTIVDEFKAFVEQMIEAKSKYEQMKKVKLQKEISALQAQAIEECEEIADGYEKKASALESEEVIGV